MRVSARMLLAYVSTCVPSMASTRPSTHIPATSSFANPLLTSVEAASILAHVVCLFVAIARLMRGELVAHEPGDLRRAEQVHRDLDGGWSLCLNLKGTYMVDVAA